MVTKFGPPVIRPWNITPEEEQVLRATDATADWMLHLPREVLKKYSGKWIAAKDCQVIAAATTYDELLQQLEGTDLQTVVIQLLAQPPRVFFR